MALGRLIFAFSLFSVCLCSDPVYTTLRNITKCQDNCTVQYSSVIQEASSNNLACERGCRFYTISEFVADGPVLEPKSEKDAETNPIKGVCYNTCVEAYNETSDSTAACKFGCDAQESSSSEKPEEEEEKPTLHLLKPLMRMQAVYSSIVGAVHVVRTSIVTYFLSDDSTIVAVESEPDIMLEILPDASEDASLEGLAAEPREFMNDEDSSDPSVVRCVSRRLGVPPYLLVASALALLLFTLYVIFAICTTASPPKGKRGLSVRADPLPLPVKLVRTEDLTKLSLMEEEDQQAPPLPTKVKLENTDI